MRIRAFLRHHRPDAAIIVVLAVLPILFFWRLVTPDRADTMIVAAGDFVGQYYPLRAYAAHELAAGRLPLWNPYQYAGQPALADIQSGALYPPQLAQVAVLHWLGKGFPPGALEWQAILHFSLAAAGAYVLGRRLALRDGCFSLRRARFAGAVVSVVFTYSGYLTGFPVQQLTILEVSAWLPWVLLGVDGLAVTQWRGARAALPWVAATALSLGLALLPGHPQTWLYVVYTALAAYAWRVFQQRKDASTICSRDYYLRAGGAAASALALAAALTAAQWVPTAEFIARSSRADMSYPALSFGLPLPELASLLYPGYLGGSPAYIGILPMLLIGLAWALARPRGEVAFWTAIGAGALVLSLGGGTFLYPLFYLLAPGFDAVRHQERVLLVYALSAAVLSGYGAAALAGPLNRLQRLTWARFERGARRVFYAGLALTFVFVYGSLTTEHRDLFTGVLRHHMFALLLLAVSIVLMAWRTRRWSARWWGMTLIVGWIAFNLFSVNWRFNLQPPAALFAPTALTEAIAARLSALDPVRIASGGLLPHGPGAAAVYGFQDIVGNTPLQLADVAEFEARVPEWRRWQLLNVHFVLSDRDLGGAGLERVYPPEPPPDDDPATRLYAVTDPFPRAWVVHAVEVIPERSAALQRIGEDSFDLRRTAVVDQPVEPTMSAEPPAAGSSARIAAFAAGELEIDVDAAGAGLLVLSEIVYPGWRAEVDGVTAPILTVDGVLRGISVPAGQHRVRVWYAPLSVQVGMALSLATLVGGMLAWGAAVRWAREPKRPRLHIAHPDLTEPFDSL